MRLELVRTIGIVGLIVSLGSVQAASEDRTDAAATIRVVDQRGQPVSDAHVYVMIETDADAPVWLADGKPGADGTFRVPHPKSDTKIREFIVSVGAPVFEVGRFKPSDANPGQPVQFTIPPREGDIAPDISMVEVFSNERVKLSDFRGQVVLLDFWASWCAPCQAPMAHYQDIMTRRAADWEGRATIIALSIDDAQTDASSHIESKGWTAISNYWSADGSETGWKSDAPVAYGISLIPTALLIGPDGVILWRGLPAQAEIERRIDKALGN